MRYLIITILAFYFSACSIFQTEESKEEEVVKNNKQTEEVYVFDDVADENKKEDIKELEDEIDSSLNESDNQNISAQDINRNNALTGGETSKVGNSFYLQLGAFSSLKRAEQYVEQITSDVPFKLSIIYNSQTALYTVRSSSYKTRAEVENIRTDFWNRNLFKDSFIVTE